MLLKVRIHSGLVTLVSNHESASGFLSDVLKYTVCDISAAYLVPTISPQYLRIRFSVSQINLRLYNVLKTTINYCFHFIICICIINIILYYIIFMYIKYINIYFVLFFLFYYSTLHMYDSTFL